MNLYRNILMIMAGLMTAACSSDSTLDDESRVDLRQPMVFGTSAAQTETIVSRATPLEGTFQTFKVGTWKYFDTTKENVMDGYHVNYSSTMFTDYGDGYNWYYEGLFGQPLRYWDLAAFPYEFRAVSPSLDGAVITTSGLSIDATTHPVAGSRSFKSQTLISDTYNHTTAESEPCVVAHVTRSKDGTDFADHDVITDNTDKEINKTGKANATREVHMPFHHLMTKVGFRIFINDPQPTSPDYRVDLNSIRITVVNDDNEFVIGSKTYTATNEQGLKNGTFSDLTKAEGEYVLLEHGRYETSSGTPYNLRQNLQFEDAFDLTPECLLQIPQGNIKIRVQIQLETDHLGGSSIEVENVFNYDTLLSLDPEKLTGDIFTWEPDYRYIYVLHVPNVHGHEIFLHSCSILPWDEVQTTDINVGL